MRSPVHLLLAVALLAWSACNEGQPGPGIAPPPEEGAACEDPGVTSCGATASGGTAVLLCTGLGRNEAVWSVNEVCPWGCSLGACLPPDTTPSPDAVDATVPPDATGPDLRGEDLPETPDSQPEEICTPDCAARVCGDDGCGGSCGTCPGEGVCRDDGTCCEPACEGKHCGDDGCGGSCGACSRGEVCNVFFQCGPPCEPVCGDKVCGPDGCGGSCGSCPQGFSCGATGQCDVCVPDCTGKECGGNGCGGICGSCPMDETCEDGTCVPACIPYCVFKSCGDDGCGGSCGGCGAGQVCSTNGQCIYVCEPVCEGKECGPDGCGGQCGKCPDWSVCDPAGLCNATCVPDCAGKACGDDGCSGTCGACAAGKVCVPSGACINPTTGCGGVTATGWCDGNHLLVCDAGIQLQVIDCLQVGKNGICTWLPGLGAYGCQESGVCVPDCTGLSCGSDGCGGSCGTCALGQSCDPATGQCLGQGACGQITNKGCCSGNTVVYCSANQLQYLSCDNQENPAKALCGWNAALGFYDCTSSAFQGPGIPYYCPGGCIPDCFQKQCGSDGCGGSCGGCPPGLVCQGGLCQAEGGGCGPYGASPVCQQDTVVWCEQGNKIVFMDCGKMGPFFYCGWNPDLFVNSCMEEVCEPACEDKECGDDGCGSVCGYCPVQKMCNDQGQCIYGSGFCGDITYEGVCQGNVVAWCQNGILQQFDCGILGPTYHCGWFEQGGYYWCVES